MSHEEAVFETGDVVADRYEIVEELGRGAYGVVYRAVQLGIGRDVAIKTLLPDTKVGSEEQQRFEREAMLISRLNHPNIVTLFDYGEHQGVLFMAMEFVAGRNLKDVIESEAPMAPARVRALVYQMLDALQFAHDNGVVHRDLKPENIQLLRNPSMDADDVEALKILDFGIAKVVHGAADGSPLNRLTQSGMAMGTPQYMSPENITGDPVSHHADLYAVGLLLYEMLTGEPAFSALSPKEVMVAHIRDEAPMLPDAPGVAAFRRGLAAALEKQPDDRVQSARQMRKMFEEDGPQAAAMAPAVAAAKPAGTSLSVPLVATVAAAAIVIFLLALVVLQDSEQPREASEAEATATESQEDAAIDEIAVEPSVEREAAAVEEEAMAEEEAIEEIEETEDEEQQVEEAVIEESTVEESAVEEAAAVPEAQEEVVDSAGRDGDGGDDDRVVEAQQGVGEQESQVVQALSQETSTEDEEVDEPAQVTLQITTEPASARVSVNGRPVGVSPVTHAVARGESVEVSASMMGYNEATQTVAVEDEDQSVEIRLERGRLQLD